MIIIYNKLLLVIISWLYGQNEKEKKKTNNSFKYAYIFFHDEFKHDFIN